MSGSGANHSLDKTESTYCSYGSLPICKKGSPYLILLKYYLKGLFDSYEYMSICKESNLITLTFLELLEF